MGLILGKSGFRKFKVGYPTVSDKYDVAGGILLGETAAHNGDVLMFGDQAGSYKVASGLTNANQVAGILLATNVKLADRYPATSDSVVWKVGEAVNLMVRGFVAVECDSTVVEANIKEGAPVYLTAAGKVTTVSSGNIATTWKFMGLYENHGTTAAKKIVAEIVL